MLMQTKNLMPPALDGAVVKIVHDDLKYKYGEPVFDPRTKRVYQTAGLRQIGVNFSPATDWAQGGPILEREKIAVWFHTEYGCWCAAGIAWMDADVESDAFLEMPDAFRGPTPLIAAMRCYVASRLGDEVEIPEELV